MTTERLVPNHELLQIPAPGDPGRTDLYDQCIAVRKAVFCEEQGFPEDVEIDECVVSYLRHAPYILTMWNFEYNRASYVLSLLNYS